LPPGQEQSDKDTEEVPNKCPNCGKRGTFVKDEETGEMVCGNCGFVLREKEEETGPEFSSSEAGTTDFVWSSDFHRSAGHGP
jgi:transcription initiation factor TFIIIB Brf1 subunit/transcription initiation factor TFIIB